MSDVAYTLNVGRKSYNYRRALVCSDIKEALDLLRSKESSELLTGYGDDSTRRIVFMFPGEGSQYINIAKDLYRNENLFRQEVDNCCEILKGYLGTDLRDIIYSSDEQLKEKGKQELEETRYAEPALFVIEYSLARLLISWGIKPEAMIGHSIGEYAAACLSGVFSLEDCLRLVAKRGELISRLSKGSMLEVSISEDELKPLVGNKISIAAVNGKDRCTVSGKSDDIEIFKEELQRRGIAYTELQPSHGFNSDMMEPILEEFSTYVRRIDKKSPKIPFISNVSGKWITSTEAVDAEYWAKHIRRTVRFSDGIDELLKSGGQIMLEVGPGSTLKTLVKQNIDDDKNHLVLNTIRPSMEESSDILYLLNTLGNLWVEGVKVRWTDFYREKRNIAGFHYRPIHLRERGIGLKRGRVYNQKQA